jgi:Zn-dependent protease with chaperone function
VTALEQILIAWLLNLSWQAPLLFLMADAVVRALRNLSARVHHQIWLLSLGIATLVPAGSLLGLWSPGASGTTERETPGWSQQLMRVLLVVVASAIAIRCISFIRAWVETTRLKRKATPIRPELLPGLMAFRDSDARSSNFTILGLPPDAARLGPLTVGILHPTILLPEWLLSSADQKTLQSALAHEMAHVYRRDMWWWMVAEVLLIPLAFHPIATMFRRRLVETREVACDEFVVENALPSLDYARALLEVARIVSNRTAALHALGASHSVLLEVRIRALTASRGIPKGRLNRLKKTAFAAGVTVLGILLILPARSLYVWLSSVPPPTVWSELVPPPPPPPPRDR